ncbi:UBX domain-containing protein 11 isoform X2 [Brachyistius frenatus]|uniref:UBX domain-containing protein 11 isoform X2 n=1 Tax=Brachyistius frenatus TaxID=100188 RepID=UPI0037E7B33A
MSSPLSMLKKTRRAPLQGPLNEQRDSQNVQPLRGNLLKEFKAELLADDSSDLNPPLPSHTSAKNASTSKSKAPLNKGAPPTDLELMSAMMQRVTLLKKTVKSQAQEIESQDKRISGLEEKLRVQEQSGRTRGPRDRDGLERRCQILQNQVDEMETFLGDYGLTWVGNGETSDAAAEPERRRGPGADLWQPDTSPRGSFRMNFDVVLQRIKELNVLAGDGESFVQTTATGARLATKDPIQLRLYSNGIVMFNGPFRSYQEHSTQRCMQELMDGYFPSELQERFPGSAPFAVHDRRDEEFFFRLPWDKFPGEGQAVCGEKDKSAGAVTSELPGKKLTTDQFLNKLPKFVVKAGRVIDIRESLRGTMQGSSDAQRRGSVILVDTPALQAMTDRSQTLNADQPPSARDVITLKVKSEDGDRTYVVKMCCSETVGHLRKYLDKHGGAGLPGYDIISAYPERHYDDDGQTLRSCGLSVNASLLLRSRKRVPTAANKPMKG